MASCSPVGVVGLIPARAGNTRVVRLRPALSGAHPRSRGEHPCASSARSWCRGSSPLARGTRRGCRQHLTRSGLIPARAGNTMFPAWINLTAGAHPRSRGEHVWVVRFPVVPLGSSPLARGTRCEDQVGVGGLGLIPARAGNTATGWCGRECRRAHPRSRGEHSKFLASSVMLRGSSPLARGTRAEEEAGTFSRGLIPARAGNTCCQCGWVVFLGAHPRSRGEHVILLRSAVSLGWLIPARAGNTVQLPAPYG